MSFCRSVSFKLCVFQWRLLGNLLFLDIWFWIQQNHLFTCRIDSFMLCGFWGHGRVLFHIHQRFGLRCCRKEGTGVAAADFTSISREISRNRSPLLQISLIWTLSCDSQLITHTFVRRNPHRQPLGGEAWCCSAFCLLIWSHSCCQVCVCLADLVTFFCTCIISLDTVGFVLALHSPQDEIGHSVHDELVWPQGYDYKR